jgi:hypothetical protein
MVAEIMILLENILRMASLVWRSESDHLMSHDYGIASCTYSFCGKF